MDRSSWKAVGNEFVQGKEYEKAIEAYTNALDNDAEWNVAVLCNRAFAWLQLARPQSCQHAISDCSTVLSIDEKNVKALYRRALARIHLKELVEAKEDLETIVSLEPGNPQVLTELESVRVQLAAAASKNLFNPEFHAKLLDAAVQGNASTWSSAVAPMPPAPPVQSAKAVSSSKVDEALASMTRECSLTHRRSALENPVSNSAWLELQAAEASIAVAKPTKAARKRVNKARVMHQPSHATDALWQSLVEEESRTRQQVKKKLK